MTERTVWRWWFRGLLVLGLGMFVLAVTQFLDGRPWWKIAISLGLGTLVLWQRWWAMRHTP